MYTRVTSSPAFGNVGSNHFRGENKTEDLQIKGKQKTELLTQHNPDEQLRP